MSIRSSFSFVTTNPCPEMDVQRLPLDTTTCRSVITSSFLTLSTTVVSPVTKTLGIFTAKSNRSSSRIVMVASCSTHGFSSCNLTLQYIRFFGKYHHDYFFCHTDPVHGSRYDTACITGSFARRKESSDAALSCFIPQDPDRR